jgi:hypothetical protein
MGEENGDDDSLDLYMRGSEGEWSEDENRRSRGENVILVD